MITKTIVALILLYSLVACAAHYTVELEGWSNSQDGRVIVRSTTETPRVVMSHIPDADW